MNLKACSILLALAASAEAMSAAVPRGCPSGGTAVPCELRAYSNDASGKVVPLHDSRLPISLGRDVEVWAESYTQYGKEWPQEKAKYQLQTERGCPGRYQISNVTPHRFRVHVLNAEADQCQLQLMLTEPRAATLVLTPVWETPPVTSLPATVLPATVPGTRYSRGDAEYIVRRLYPALLARDPDAAGFAAAVADVQGGRLELVIDKTLRSPEYNDLQRHWSASQTLQTLYNGLFGRAVDADGQRAYLPRIARGDTRAVVLELLRSQEFRDRLAARA